MATWFNKNMVTDHKNVFNNVRVVLTNGKTYRSKKNTSVRPTGFVA